MERLQAILRHPLWRENFQQIQEWERDRVFCRHTVEHFLDVARIAHIENLEAGLEIPKVWVYAAALLHDLGRAAQERDGTPHHLAGAALAGEILRDCGFETTARGEILRAIAAHRDPATGAAHDLAGLLYRADKKSRLCLFCPAQGDCNWPEEKMNLTITV